MNFIFKFNFVSINNMFMNVFQDNDYFATSEEERVNMLQEVDRVAELLSLTR